MASDDCEPIGLQRHSTISFYRRHWLLLHLFGYALTAVSSFGMLFHFPFLRDKFRENCPLYAVPVVIKKSDIYSFVSDGEQSDNAEATVWGNDKTCDYVFTISALSFIIAFIWCWFFCYCSAGNKLDGSVFVSKDQKWRVLPPAMVFSLMMSILTLVNCCVLSSGMLSFCSALEDTVVESCTKASNSEWSYFTKLNGFYKDTTWSITEAWLAFGGWAMQSIMIFVHCLEGPGSGYIKNY